MWTCMELTNHQQIMLCIIWINGYSWENIVLSGYNNIWDKLQHGKYLSDVFLLICTYNGIGHFHFEPWAPPDI